MNKGTNGGYQCPDCGAWIYPNQEHQCINSPQPFLPIAPTYNYKCPNCKGEFNTPALYSQGTSSSIVNYVCPFCGAGMVGLNG